MALLDQDGHYIKIENVSFDGIVTYRIYKDKEQRTNGPAEFEITRQETCNIDIARLNDIVEENMTVKNSVISAGYKGMKELTAFQECQDI